ncbi:MAG: hypothetical protein JRJ12_11010 [Deltaproteobacteria bacterium]|nr:hypothetical protein [Deltaproteobacteria bacterium]
MEQRNFVSVSWPDHLVFGEGDGRLADPASVRRRMVCWRQEVGARALLWRVHRSMIRCHYYAARGYQHPANYRRLELAWNVLETVPLLARDCGLEPYLYVSLFDEGWPLPPKKIRQVSYHNAMHLQHRSWQTAFSRQHPEYTVVDRSGNLRQWGVLSLAYPEVRSHFSRRFTTLLDAGDYHGLFVCLRSQSRPADFADQFGFNEPVRQDYLQRYGRDICRQDFDLQKWRDLLGDYLTAFMAELRSQLQARGCRLAVGAARGDVLGPPLGNTTLDWRAWIRRGLIDELIINQNSCQCPSMWHQLWPMHRGCGYLQNYLEGLHLPPLLEQLSRDYAPEVAQSTTALYVSRLWDERSSAEEEQLLAHPAVRGLVFGSFRFDNPGPVARNDWRV